MRIVAEFKVTGENVPQLWKHATEVAARLFACKEAEFDPHLDGALPVDLRVQPVVRGMNGANVTLWEADVMVGTR